MDVEGLTLMAFMALDGAYSEYLNSKIDIDCFASSIHCIAEFMKVYDIKDSRLIYHICNIIKEENLIEWAERHKVE